MKVGKLKELLNNLNDDIDIYMNVKQDVLQEICQIVVYTPDSMPIEFRKGNEPTFAVMRSLETIIYPKERSFNQLSDPDGEVYNI